MPMLTTSVIVLPVAPRHAPLRTRSVKRRISSSTSLHAGHHVLAVDEDGPAGAVAERDVQDGAVLGAVDLLAGEHPVAPRLDLRRAGEIEQEAQRLSVDAVLRIVEEEIVEAQRVALEALRVLREEIAKMRVAEARGMGAERLPGRRGGERRHVVARSRKASTSPRDGSEGIAPRPIAVSAPAALAKRQTASSRCGSPGSSALGEEAGDEAGHEGIARARRVDGDDGEARHARRRRSASASASRRGRR